MKFFLRDLKIPSSNNRLDEKIFTIGGKTRIHKERTQEYLDFISIIQRVCIDSGVKPIKKPTHKNKSRRNVSVGLVIYFDKGGRSDIDGNLKCLFDSFEGYAYENDSQIKRFHKLEIQDYSGFNGFEVEFLRIVSRKGDLKNV